MALYMETTKISSAKTAQEITALLAKAGVTCVFAAEGLKMLPAPEVGCENG